MESATNAGNANEFYVASPGPLNLLFSTATTHRASRRVLGNFAAGTHFEFRLKSMSGSSTHWWSTRQASNADGRVHVQVSQPYAGCLPAGSRAYLLRWEDLYGGGDNDFDDMVAVVRVNGDADGDALWDDWERCGIDHDGRPATAAMTLPGANWQKKDIYVYYNYMGPAADGHHHRPDAMALTAVRNAFAAAPVSNPNGTTGINIHFEQGAQIAHAQVLNFNGGPGVVDFDNVKAANFPDWKRFAYHYMIFAHHHTAGSTSSGLAEVGGNDFIVSLGGWAGNRGTWRDQAGTIMHELGHNLNLGHGGVDGVNYKPNYLSVMNYRFQILGIPNGLPSVTNYRIDYSRHHRDLNELSLNEQFALWGSLDQTIWRCPSGATKMMPVTNSIDWDCDGTIEPGVLMSIDLNGDGAKNLLRGYDDWRNIMYAFQQSGTQMDGSHPDDHVHDEPHIDLKEMDLLVREFHVGLGALYPHLIQQAYDRAGGRAVLGDMVDPAESRQGTQRQDFITPDEGRAAIFHIHDEKLGPVVPAHVLRGDVLVHYDRLKGPEGPLGRPTSDVYKNRFGHEQASFANGMLTYEPERKAFVPVPYPNQFRGWKAEYFNNPHLAGSPTYVRDEPALGHMFSGAQAPEDGTLGLINGGFSVRYSKTMRLDQPQQLMLSTATNGGIRVMVNGRPMINGWQGSPTHVNAINGTFPEPKWAKRAVEMKLEPGEHTIVVEYSNRNQEGLGYSDMPVGMTQLALRINKTAAFRNEQPVILDSAPQIFQDRTFLPIRFIAESFNLEVGWDGQKRQVTVKEKDKTIVLTIDDPRAYVNGKEYILDAAPRIVNDRTLIPVRFVTEQIGAKVSWDNDTRTVMVVR